jgi:hypothetical protein
MVSNFPAYAIPKINGTVRVVINFSKFNLLLKRHPFPIPKIGDMIRSIEEFNFATASDLNIGYCHIKLDSDADDQKLCSIVFTWHMENTNTNAYPWVSRLLDS